MRVFTISVMMLICSISSATAEAVKLSGDEIRDLISGNTAFGRLDGAKYHQWFGPDHVTLRTTEGSTTMSCFPMIYMSYDCHISYFIN